MSKPLIEVKNLRIETAEDSRTLVNNISFEVFPGEAVGVVGESGSGKTLTALSILGLTLPSQNSVIPSIHLELFPLLKPEY